MRTITKRNEQGGIDVERVPMVIEWLAGYKDTGLDPSDVRDLEIIDSVIANMHDCTDCAKYPECEHSDELRINCFTRKEADNGQTD